MENYPGIYILILKHLQRENEIEEYMDSCRNSKNLECEKYSRYVHGYLQPFLEQKREKGLLKKQDKKLQMKMFDHSGAKEIDVYYDYSGEVDQNGNACGLGIATKTTMIKS